jgi:hypothetical protein
MGSFMLFVLVGNSGDKYGESPVGSWKGASQIMKHRTVLALTNAGWSPERSVGRATVMDLLLDLGLTATATQIQFFERFNGLNIAFKREVTSTTFGSIWAKRLGKRTPNGLRYTGNGPKMHSSQSDWHLEITWIF